MRDEAKRWVTWTSAGLVALGIALGITVDMGLLALTALGAFGPGILRELGLLEDRDELQQLADYRAGYHAYLAGGTTAVLAVAALNAGEANLEAAGSVWLALVLVVLWLSWLFRSLLGFWGPQKTAFRVLSVFGSFWALFVVLGHFAEPVAMLAESLVVAPFFVLAWSAGRWPRASGGALLALSLVLFGWFFDFGREFVRWPSQVLTFAMLVVPLLACGVALLRTDPEEPVPA